ncbi:hypothetical protein M3Y98_00152100 [Aphelenchoides besseyi]|nr:hypothetical protein M3Y98_00152100 [Aphelenchoides besseyi]KAI6199809.1 hypothetical protein M3Y96_00666400 [Aphelenchoides besseyi]
MVMQRKDVEQLCWHHYRLHTSAARPVVSTSPPRSMWSSPKSTFYRPFALRPKSADQCVAAKLTRRRGREELAHFLSTRRTSPNSQFGFNAFARSKTVSSVNLSELNRLEGRSKLLNSRVYQPPQRIHLHSGSTSSTSTSQQSADSPFPKLPSSRINCPLINQTKTRRAPNTPHDGRYVEFKDQVLSDIILRGVFTNRVIEDSFQREISRRSDLDKRALLTIMSETLDELGIKSKAKSRKPAPNVRSTQKHVTIAEPQRSKRRLASVSSGSHTPSSSSKTHSTVTSKTTTESRNVRSTKVGGKEKLSNRQNSTTSSNDFNLNASPPQSASSLSSDIEEIARRLSNTIETADDSENGEFVDDAQTEYSTTSSELEQIIEKARSK